MHKNNSFLYYFALFILAIALFKYYNNEKVKNNITVERETRDLTIDFGDIQKSASEVKDAITEIRGEKKRTSSPILLNQSHIVYIKNESFTNKVNLCFNSYEMDFKLFSEEGEKIYDNPKFTLNQIKDDENFYNFLQNSLVLTSQDEIAEIFIPKLELLPPQFTEKETDKVKSGLLKLLFIKSNQKNSLLINGVIVNSSIILNYGKKRAIPQFLCGEKVKISYTIYDANQNEIASEKTFVILNGEGSEFEKILQYMVLASNSQILDGEFPSYKYDQTIKDQTLTIKGIIELSND